MNNTQRKVWLQGFISGIEAAEWRLGYRPEDNDPEMQAIASNLAWEKRMARDQLQKLSALQRLVSVNGAWAARLGATVPEYQFTAYSHMRWSADLCAVGIPMGGWRWI